MVDVAIDRFHARYHGFDRSDTARLDRALVRVIDVALDRALADHGLPDVFAVCIPSLELSVDLEPSLSVDVSTRRWADRLAEVIAGRVAESIPTSHANGSGPGWHSGGPGPLGTPAQSWDDDVVTYRREADVVADIVASVASGDRRRLWAWNQTGVWPRSTWPTAHDLALLLVRRPTLCPAVLAAASRSESVPLTAGGWRAVADSVVRALGAGPMVEAYSSRAVAGPDGDIIEDRRHRPAVPPGGSGPNGSPRSWAADIARRIPRSVLVDLPPDQRAPLAVLALAMGSPAQVRSHRAVAAVAAALATAAGADPTVVAGRRSVPAAGERAELSDLPQACLPADGSGSTDHGLAASPGEAPAGSDRQASTAAVTDFGGVLFLLHPLRELAVMESVLRAIDFPSRPEGDRPDPAGVLAVIVAAVTGVAIADPGVRAVCGPPTDDETAAAGQWTATTGSGLVAEQAVRITDWLRDRLGPSDLEPVWPRRAVIEHQPGWLEVVLPLDSVDTQVRSAGLDLDPGFVWWLGSMVRFRYV